MNHATGLYVFSFLLANESYSKYDFREVGRVFNHSVFYSKILNGYLIFSTFLCVIQAQFKYLLLLVCSYCQYWYIATQLNKGTCSSKSKQNNKFNCIVQHSD